LVLEFELRSCGFHYQAFSEDLGPCIPRSRRIQAEHVDKVRLNSLLREGKSLILPSEEGEEGAGSLGWSFLYHLELDVERQYVITWLLSPVGLGEEPLRQEREQSQSIPSLACLKLPLRDNIPKILCVVAERGWSSFGTCFGLKRGYRHYLLGILPLCYCSPWGLDQWSSFSESLSSPIKIAYGHPVYL
jgi:hypothetical protein